MPVKSSYYIIIHMPRKRFDSLLCIVRFKDVKIARKVDRPSYRRKFV